jgi:hypothetical protein
VARNHLLVLQPHPSCHLASAMKNASTQKASNISLSAASEPMGRHPLAWSCIEKLPPRPSTKLLKNLALDICFCSMIHENEVVEDKSIPTPVKPTPTLPLVRSVDSQTHNEWEGPFAAPIEPPVFHPMSEQDCFDQWINPDLAAEPCNEVPVYSYEPVRRSNEATTASAAGSPATLNGEPESPVSAVVPSPSPEPVVASPHQASKLGLPGGHKSKDRLVSTPDVQQPVIAYSHPSSERALSGSTVGPHFCTTHSGILEALINPTTDLSALCTCDAHKDDVELVTEEEYLPVLQELIQAQATGHTDPSLSLPEDLEIASPKSIRFRDTRLLETLADPCPARDAPEDQARPQVQSPARTSAEDSARINALRRLLGVSCGGLRYLLGVEEHTPICGGCLKTGVHVSPCESCGANDPVMSAAPVGLRVRFRRLGTSSGTSTVNV